MERDFALVVNKTGYLSQEETIELFKLLIRDVMRYEDIVAALIEVYADNIDDLLIDLRR